MSSARQRTILGCMRAAVAALVATACGVGVQPPAPRAAVATDPGIEQVLVAACYPCHASPPAISWHGRLAPSSWPGSARAVLDFSQWGTYDVARRTEALNAIAAVVKSGSMPPGDYTFFDHAAKLTADQRAALAAWATAEAATMPAH